jgi:hypothetical protein
VSTPAAKVAERDASGWTADSALPLFLCASLLQTSPFSKQLVDVWASEGSAVDVICRACA